MVVSSPRSRCRAGCAVGIKARARIWRLAGDQPILIAQQEPSHGLPLGNKKELVLQEQIPPAA